MRNEKKKKVSKLEFTGQYVLPILAILISVGSLYYSYQSNKIAENSFYLNLKPIVLADFFVDNFKKEYAIKITNDGSNPVHELRIKSLARLVSENRKEILISSNSEKYWHYVEKLEPRDSIKFDIKYEELKNTFALSENMPNENVLSVHLFYITFRRLPDRSVYTIKKYLLLYSNPKHGGFVVIDLDRNYFQDHIELRKYLEIFDNERL